ncbi:MAG: hypothetical protein ACI3XS_05520 [Eubacteriales bacterium]
MNDLLEKKYIYTHDDDDDILAFFPDKPENKYGFIALKNPDYLKHKRDNYDGEIYCDEREYIYRKPNPSERREIVINTIIESCGRAFSIPKLASLLAISDRTLQTLLKSLQSEKLIEVIPRYSKNGARKSNVYKYIGSPCKFYGSGLNLHILYDPLQDVGFRHWAWRSQSFAHNKVWYDLYTLCKIKFDSRIARGEYLKKNNLPLIVPEEINYLALRYSYWRGNNELLGNVDSNEVQYSRDGVIKVSLHTQETSKVIKFFEYKIELRFLGTKDNPEIDIYDHKTKDNWATFTWFTENVIERTTPIDENHSEQFFILGDFTTK